MNVTGWRYLNISDRLFVIYPCGKGGQDPRLQSSGFDDFGFNRVLTVALLRFESSLQSCILPRLRL